MKKLVISIRVLIVLSSCSSFDQELLNSNFITVDGTKFLNGSLPYYFVGTNFWYGCYLGSPGESGNRERLKLELDKLKSLNIDNLRILAASENSSISKSLKPAIQPALGKYNEDLLEGLDFLLFEMNKRGMHAVIYLNNYWEWSGGMGQYVSWVNDVAVVDPGDFSDTWKEYNKFVSSFYRNSEAQKYFQKFVKAIITRKNKFTNKYYLEDPTIMAWQLANEPRPGQGKDGIINIEHYLNWIDETAAYIKSLDANHMVTTGNEGLMGSLGSEEYYLKSHRFKSIDYMTFHLWAKNWGWFDANRIDETYDTTEINAINYINNHIKFARKLNKPITLEEFGLPRNFEYPLRGTKTDARDMYFETIFNLISDSASIGAPIAGSNFWTWGGDGFMKHDDAIWRKGDPFTGDPPQEPQGLNSVFNTDYTTLKIIKEHSMKMKSLTK